MRPDELPKNNTPLSEASNAALLTELAARLGFYLRVEGPTPGDVPTPSLEQEEALGQAAAKAKAAHDTMIENIGQASDTSVGQPAPTEQEDTSDSVQVSNHLRVVRTPSTADRVYLLNDEAKTRQWVTNPEVLASLGFTLADVVEMDDNQLLEYQQGKPLYNAGA
jgi:hypothetical protein